MNADQLRSALQIARLGLVSQGAMASQPRKAGLTNSETGFKTVLANQLRSAFQIARLGLVSQGAMASQLNDLATGAITASQFTDANTGDALNTAVAAARAPGETLIGNFVEQEKLGNAPAPAPAVPTPTPTPAPQKDKSAGVGSAGIIIGVVVGVVVLL